MLHPLSYKSDLKISGTGIVKTCTLNYVWVQPNNMMVHHFQLNDELKAITRGDYTNINITSAPAIMLHEKKLELVKSTIQNGSPDFTAVCENTYTSLYTMCSVQPGDFLPCLVSRVASWLQKCYTCNIELPFQVSQCKPDNSNAIPKTNFISLCNT